MSEITILAIDQGTTNTKAILVDQRGHVVARASHSPDVNYPQPAWVEQDPAQIWRTVVESIDDCLVQIDDPKIAAVAVTNQRETVLAWNRKTGKALGPAIVWQCHRTAPFCNDLRSRGLESKLRQKTGLTIDPMFSGSKMRWLLDNNPDVARAAENGELCLGTVDSWVLWNLTGGAVHACDYTNASRTQLFNLSAVKWDEELLDLFGIPASALPHLQPSGSFFGETKACGMLPGGIPITSLIGDSHAALYGHAGFQLGSIKATYGTGSSLMTPMSQPVISNHGLSTTVAWARERTAYALEGNIYSTGAAVQWLAQLLGFQKDMGDQVEALALTALNTGGVYLVPAFVGLGAPHWNESARGLITGITRGSGAPELALAAIQSIAFQVRDVFEVMAQESGADLQVLLADGGASKNNLLMQFQADMIEKPVLRSLSGDVSPVGASYMAGLMIGFWSSEEEILSLPRSQQRFEPKMSAVERDALLSGWQTAVSRTVFEPCPSDLAQ
jgi:glycerol kinase